jgi:WD40 repeat protein
MLNRFLLLSMLLLALYAQAFAQEDCSAAPFPRLRMGLTAQTSSGQSNNVRDAADADANRLGQIPPDSQFQVLSDATCADGYYWVQVDYQGLVGWTVEGAEGEYWLIPVLSNSQIMSPENISQLQIVQELACPEDENAEPFAWSPDGTKLLWACQHSGFYLTDWLSQETTQFSLTRNLQSTSTIFASFFADGSRFFQYIYPEGAVYDTRTGEQIAAYDSEDNAIANFAIASHENTLAFAGEFGIYLTDLMSYEGIDFLSKDISGLVYSLAFSPDGERLAFGADGEEIKVWTIAMDTILHIPIEADHVQRLSFSPSGRYILASLCIVPNRGDCNQAAMQWIDSSNGEVTTTWQEEGWNEIFYFHFGQDLVFMRVDRHFEIFQISTDARLFVSSDQDSFREILPSVDGRLLVTANDNKLEIYGIP